jgi:chromosome segregation ATPase
MWSSIKSALFVDGEATPEASKVSAPVQGVQPTAGGAMNAQPVPVVSDNSFIEALRKAVKTRPTAFTSLLAAADKLANIIPDPNTRLKAAYATVSGEGRGLKEVVGAIEVHIADLEGQKLQFMSALEAQRTAALGTLESEMNSIGPANQSAAQQIQSMTQQIQQLQELIARNTNREAELKGKITAEQARFTVSQQQFESALVLVKTELESQRSAITSTLTSN